MVDDEPEIVDLLHDLLEMVGMKVAPPRVEVSLGTGCATRPRGAEPVLEHGSITELTQG